MMQLLRSLTPPRLLGWYHALLSVAGAFWYRHPSRTLLVIGVTGTTGKSTVVEMLSAVFGHAGRKVGAASTIRFQIGDASLPNSEKMTMLGRWRLQKLLRQMADAGCTVAIIETTSQGLAQNRHIGIDYDCAVITNLSPEHIESHGSFGAYRAAKRRLFASLSRARRKLGIPKVSIVNLSMTDAPSFLQYPADKRIGFSTLPALPPPDAVLRIMPRNLETTGQGSTFVIANQAFRLPLPGVFNVANALAAIAVGTAYGIPLATIAAAFAHLHSIPGRFATVVQEPFRVIVDYAHEPAGLEAVYQAAQTFRPRFIIAVLGSAGGGRDKWKRPVLGKIAAGYAQFVIVTNEDPYDEDPMEIINQVADGAVQAGKKDGQNLFRILDRREGIRKALALAHAGDLVMITGKGSEPVMAVAGGKKIPWSDEETVGELLSKRSNQVQT